jgi:hypothetical protein
MNLFNFIRNYTEQIAGQFTNYDHTKAVVVIPIGKGRFQTVLAVLKPSQSSGRELAIFTSKVCEFTDSLNTKQLLEESAKFDYCKFIIEDGYVKIEASCTAATITEDQVKEMIQEVALVSDKFEMELTGKDIH